MESCKTLCMKNRNLDYEKVSQKIISQLKDYLKISHQDGFIVWVSGGIDSALVSTLCAMTGEKTLLLELPIHQNQDEVTRAQEHIAELEKKFPNVCHHVIDLSHTFETFKKALPSWDDESQRYLAYVNARSRLRAVTLYTLGNEHQYLVVGTGNKVEDYGIWFFTKYGDGAVDISPIGNLYKSEVFALAKKLWVVESILQAQPTDGLHSNGATDEDQIGATYDELEWAMVHYDLGERKDDFIGRENEVMAIYSQRHEQNLHKMSMPCIFEI